MKLTLRFFVHVFLFPLFRWFRFYEHDYDGDEISPRNKFEENDNFRAYQDQRYKAGSRQREIMNCTDSARQA